jgi:hypothetical protein
MNEQNKRALTVASGKGPYEAASVGSTSNTEHSSERLISQLRALSYPDENQLRWLMHRQGVSDTALLRPTHIRAANVTFLDSYTFDFDAAGVPALLFEEDEDWIAWQPKTGQIASWASKAFALGQDAIFNPATYFVGSMLRVHQSPLEWLKAERDGIVIVQPQYAHSYLRDACMSCGDQTFAKQLTEWIQPPPPKAEIFIEILGEAEEQAAA